MPKIDMTQNQGLNFTETVVVLPFGDGGKTLELRTGKLAKQACGSVIARVGGTVALASVVLDDKPTLKDFFPLMVDYREKFYSTGRIPGGFIKRENRPSDNESLRARLIDRTIRPLFPDGFKNEVQVYILILAMDLENPAELVAMCAASAALHISEIPFEKPIAGVRVGRRDGKFIVNPTLKEMDGAELDLVVAGHKGAINMVECGAKEVSEADMIAALEVGHAHIRDLCDAFEAMRKKIGKPKVEFTPAAKDKELVAKVEKLAKPHIADIQKTFEKAARDLRSKKAVAEIQEALGEAYAERAAEVKGIFEHIDEREMRHMVVNKGIRADGRKPAEIRPIWAETATLPGVHGSSIFTRGQTQALAVVTLGSVDDTQTVDEAAGLFEKRFYLHYNFPSFSVGEVRPPRGPGRREIGHGRLAERAIDAILPHKDVFPYTIRLVIDILESNGSSSMATVCSGCMALMDAGVPISAPVAGIAMGLITEESSGKMVVISDIQGIEDHCGDMDFKVTGTRNGITALQMDIKVEGVTSELLGKALDQARAGREHILAKMAEAISEPAGDLKPNAPRITIVKIPVEKIREVIGSGGKIIRELQEKSGAKIDIEDDGSVYVSATNGESAQMALDMISGIVTELEEGTVMTGKVIRVMESGAIVQLTPNKDGMIHISELEHHRVERVEDVVNEGDIVTVKIVEVDKARGRVRLSRKAVIEPPEGHVPSEGGGRPHREGHHRSGGHGGERRDREHRPHGGREHHRESRGGGDRPQGGGDASRRPRPPRPPREEVGGGAGPDGLD